MKIFLCIEIIIFLIFWTACREDGELNVTGLLLSEFVINAELAILYILYSLSNMSI